MSQKPFSHSLNNWQLFIHLIFSFSKFVNKVKIRIAFAIFHLIELTLKIGEMHVHAISSMNVTPP